LKKNISALKVALRRINLDKTKKGLSVELNPFLFWLPSTGGCKNFITTIFIGAAKQSKRRILILTGR